MESLTEEATREELSRLRTLIARDLHNAVLLAGKLVSDIENISDLPLKGEILHVAGLAYHEIGRFNDALKCYGQALEIRRKCGEKKGASISLNNIGLVYHDIGQFKEAIPFYMEAIQLKQDLHELRSLTASYENLGVVYQKLAMYKSAMEVYYKSLKISEDLNDPLRMALTYQNIGIVHCLWGNNQNALEMYQKAMELRKDSNDKKALIQLENNIGIILKNLKKHDEALHYFNQCLNWSEAIQYRTGVLAAHNNIGEILLSQENYLQALDAYLKCYQLAEKHFDYAEQCASAINIGQIYIHLNQYNEAFNFLQIALSLCSRSENAANEREVYWCLIQIHEKRGELAQALDCYRKYDKLKDSIMNVKTANEINELKIKYEVEKKENEIQQTKLLQIESELKALRAQMDPHFIFNALGSMRKELLEGNIENADRYIVRFSRLLRLILDTTRTPIVRLSDNLELLHLYIQIEQTRQGNKFDYEIKLSKGIKPEEIQIPGLVLQPLVENAIVHGLFNKTDGQGKLLIAFRKKGNIIEVKIEDNGVGRNGGGIQRRDGHRSHAMAIIQETLELTWHNSNVKDFFVIKDKVGENGEPLGTDVTVLLPLRLM